MSGKYQRYEAYRESGISHLGDVPQGWTTKQLKRSVEACVNGIWGSESTGGEEDITVIRVADFDRPRLGVKDRDFTKRAVSEKERQRRLLRFGDLLLEKSGGGEKTQVGQVVLYARNDEAVSSNFVAKMTPLEGYDSAYLNYSFSALYRDGINTCSIKQNTGIQNLDSNSYLSEHWAFPCQTDQTQIAKFLDYETAKIDALIEKQQRLIALLKEKRQAVISHAVTKGLNPDAPMRDSGVEWLGEIPAHWEVWRSKRLFPESKLRSGVEDEQLTASQDWGVITQREFVRRAGRRVVQINQHLGKRKRVERDDFVISMRSFQGGLERAWTSGGVRSSYVVLKPVNLVNVGYFERLFKSGQYIQALQSTANFIRDGQDLNYQNFCKVALPLPPQNEQCQIAEYLGATTETIDALVDNSHASVELLQERRTALISAAVTGKIDVRDWKAPDSQPEAGVA